MAVYFTIIQLLASTARGLPTMTTPTSPSPAPVCTFKKVLIANRGEIALRIIRACREMGIATVVVYSQADADSLAVKLADESYCIGPNAAAHSYLNVANIISVALMTQSDAIHPGYGFLSENADFAELCAAHGIQFIGSPADAIRKMGDKAVAKKTMKDAGLPVVPGTDGPIESIDEALRWADSVGYPVILKASAGGGGKGMRLVHAPDELENQFQMAQSEAKAAFGNPEIYAEKYLLQPRHIEFQVLADRYGHVVHLGERECSIQRRHQKLFEEAPSSLLTPERRAEIGAQIVQAVQRVGYEGAGTVECLFDAQGNWYFMEMNTRIQVEHPVTEAITGVDLLQWQIRIAMGEPLTLQQDDITLTGHALECRLNAEEVSKNFMPMPGTINGYLPPGGPGVRVDSHAYTGYKIPPYYDSLVAKLIVWAPTRLEAITRMQRALGEFAITGIPTTIPFHERLMKHPVFREGKEIATSFVEQYSTQLIN
jgi:acetyl-CoA carboxylase, biotin carboxylase subunit